MTAKHNESETFEARESFSTTIHGRAYTVTAGDRASGAHELVKTHPYLFRPMTVKYPADETAVAGKRS